MHQNGGVVTLMARWTTQVVWLCLSVLVCGFSALAQSQQTSSTTGAESAPPVSPQSGASAGELSPHETSPGSVKGAVFDPSGTAVSSARIKITCGDPSSSHE